MKDNKKKRKQFVRHARIPYEPDLAKIMTHYAKKAKKRD